MTPKYSSLIHKERATERGRQQQQQQLTVFATCVCVRRGTQQKNEKHLMAFSLHTYMNVCKESAGNREKREEKMAACFMANCQVLSFDKVHNGQKVKPTHRTHTLPPSPPTHKLRTKLPEQNTHRHEDFFGVFLCLHCQLRLRLVPGQFPKFSSIWKIFGQAVLAAQGGRCQVSVKEKPLADFCQFICMHVCVYLRLCMCFGFFV